MLGRRRFHVLIVVFALLTAAAGSWLLLPNRTPDLPPEIDPKDYQLARNRFLRTFDREPDHEDTLMMLAEVAAATGRPEQALAAFDAIRLNHPRYGSAILLQRAILQLDLDQAVPAEHDLRRFMTLIHKSPAPTVSQIVAAESWLAYLLSVQLRLDERHQLLREVHEQGRASLTDSKQYFFPRLLIWKSDTGWTALKSFLANAPDDLLLNAAHGRYLISNGQLQEAEQRIRSLRQKFRDHPQVIVAWLELHYERDDWSEIQRELDRIDANAAVDHPFVVRWLSGERALREQSWRTAVQHFQSALERDPTNPAVHMGLLKALQNLNRTTEADRIRERSAGLARIRVHMERVNEDSPDSIRQLVGECRTLGFTDAADAFERHLQRLKTDTPPPARPDHR